MSMWWNGACRAQSLSPRPRILPIAGFLFALFLGLYILAWTSPAGLGRSAALVVRRLFFPLLLLGLALQARAQFMPAGAARARFQTLAWILLLVPIVAVIAYVEKSCYLFLYYEAVVLAFPFACATACAVGAHRIATGRSNATHRPATMMLIALGWIAVGVIWSPRLLRDLFLSPTVVEGTVVRKREENRPRRAYSSAATSYVISVDGPIRVRKEKAHMYYETTPSYYVTRDLFWTLQEGDHIRARASAGSDTVLSVQ